MKDRLLMGIDIGTGGGRCFIFNLSGEEVASTYKEWTYIFPPNIPYAVEFDPNEMWNTIKYCIRETLAKSNISPNQIVGISSTSQRQGFVLLDKYGNELYAAPNMDSRAFVEAEELEKLYGKELYRITGRWPLPFFAPCRLMWIKKHQPEKFKAIEKLLMLSDWVIYKLSGKTVSEPSIASSSMLFNIEKREWSKEMSELVGVSEDIFPEIHESGECVGVVTKKASLETGLSEGTPVITGGADTQCGLIGTAAIERGQTTIVAGTSTPIQMALDEPIFSNEMKTWTSAHAIRRRWVIESNAIWTGLAFRWFRDALCDLEKIIAKILNTDTYQIIDKEIESVPIGSNGIMAIFSNIMDAKRTLKTRPRGAIFGIVHTRSDLTGKKEIARAIIENTCFAVLGNCLQLEDVSKIKLKEVRMCGGATKSKLWSQIQADVLGLPIYVPKVKEATSLGVAICAGIGSDLYKNVNEAISSLVQWETIIEPDLIAHEKYLSLFRKWCQLHDTIHALTDENVLQKW
ncbi:MAG: FGGY family carbohydrate kinase [Nitrososphaeria archaeon]